MLDNLGISELQQAGVAIVLIVMIIIFIRAAQATILKWLETAQKRNADLHIQEIKRLEAEDRQVLAQQALDREQNVVLRGIADQLKRNQEQADSQRLVEQSLVTSINQIVQAVHQLNTYLDGTDQRMAAVTEARITWQRAIQADVGTMLARLDGHQTQMDEIAKRITILTDLPALRHETAKILLLASEIGEDVKRLLARDQEPGEGKESDQTTIEQAAEPAEIQKGQADGQPPQES